MYILKYPYRFWLKLQSRFIKFSLIRLKVKVAVRLY